MNIKIKLIAVVSCSFLSTGAWAWFEGQSSELHFSYACVGLDGIPITNDNLASQCCDGSGGLKGNAPDICRSGFYGSLEAEAAKGAGASISIAMNTIKSVKDLNGATTGDLKAPTSQGCVGPSCPAGGAQSQTGAITSAANNGGGSGDSGDSSTGIGGFIPSAGNGTGQGGGAGAGAGGAGSGLGTSSAGTGKKSGAGGDGANGQDTYTPNGYAKSGGHGADGKSDDGGGFNFGSLLGAGLGGGKSGSGSGEAGDVNFDDAAKGKDGLSEDALSGSPVDPSDYFNRIDKSASIFKIVSQRYAKETTRKHVGLAENK